MAYEVTIGRSEADRKRLGLQGCVLLGKHYVKMGQTSSLSNEVFLDVSRSHVVFLSGKRGSGKCLVAGTRVTLGDGSVVPIEQLAESRTDILSLDASLKISPAKREGFYSRQVRRVLSIQLRSGREITLTPEHPLLTVRGWVQAQNLTVNDRIATPREEAVFGDEELGDAPVKLLAYFIAEGHTKGHYVRFVNFDPEIVDDFKQAVAEFDTRARLAEVRPSHFAVYRNTAKYDPAGVTRDERGRITGGSMRVHERTRCDELLITQGVKGKLAAEKSVPEAVFRLPKTRLALFLNRLFSCDGTIYEKKNSHSCMWQVQYASKSKRLIQDVQHLLLRFGILSSIRRKNVKCNGKRFLNFELTVQDTKRYLDEIGFVGEKHVRAQRAKKELSQVVHNPNVDTIPRELWDFYRPKSWAAVGRTMGYAYPKAMRESMRYSPSRQKLLQIAMADEREDIRLLAQSDIFWDSVASITERRGIFTVYDITVPGNHNFVANDIIVHNSHTLGVLAEGISSLPPDVAKNIAVIILDTMGIFWTMKYPNQRDRDLLEEWGMRPHGLDVEVFVPQGLYQDLVDAGIPADKPFGIAPSELSPGQWVNVFGLSPTSGTGALLEEVVAELQEKGDFTLDQLLKAVNKKDADKASLRAADNLIRAAQRWGIFSDKSTRLSDLITPGKVTVLDVSPYATLSGTWNIRALVIGIVAQKLFTERMLARRHEEHEELEKELAFQPEDEQGDPVVWMLIDEAHEFLPKEGSTPATDALVTLLREGRQPGVSLVLASQQPGKIHTDVMTQSDIIISHRVTAKVDTDALSMLTQSYMRGDLDVLLNELPRMKGAAVVLDDSNEKIYSIRVRPRFTWHGGSDPDALRGVTEL